MTRFSESVVEDAALAWLATLGYAPDIVASEPAMANWIIKNPIM
jgi:hypothetical protein